MVSVWHNTINTHTHTHTHRASIQVRRWLRNTNQLHKNQSERQTERCEYNWRRENTRQSWTYMNEFAVVLVCWIDIVLFCGTFFLLLIHVCGSTAFISIHNFHWFKLSKAVQHFSQFHEIEICYSRRVWFFFCMMISFHTRKQLWNTVFQLFISFEKEK